MNEETKELENKITAALCDPLAPWYGSDLVSWVGNYIEQVNAKIEMLRKELNKEN